MLKKRKGQSILEYILVLTAIVGVIIWGASTVIKKSVVTGMADAQKGVENVAGKLATVSTP